MNQFGTEMVEECRLTEHNFRAAIEAFWSSTAPSTLVRDIPSEVGLPERMASLGLDESSAPVTEETCIPSEDSLWLRRSQRKQAVPRTRVAVGAAKRRCTLKQYNRTFCLHESDDEIKEFYENYNKKFKRQETKTLETIYEEPREKNGTVVFSGPKRKRLLDFASKAKLKKRQSKIKLLLLERGNKPEEKHFSTEDMKERLAQTGLVTLSAQ